MDVVEFADWLAIAAIPLASFAVMAVFFAIFFGLAYLVKRKEGTLNLATPHGEEVEIWVNRLTERLIIKISKKRKIKKLLWSKRPITLSLLLSGKERMNVQARVLRHRISSPMEVQVYDSEGLKIGERQFSLGPVLMASYMLANIVLIGLMVVSALYVSDVAGVTAGKYRLSVRLDSLIENVMSSKGYREVYGIKDGTGRVEVAVSSRYVTGEIPEFVGHIEAKVKTEADGAGIDMDVKNKWQYNEGTLAMSVERGGLVLSYDGEEIDINYGAMIGKWVDVSEEPSMKKRQMLFGETDVQRAQAASMLAMHLPVGNYTKDQQGQIKKLIKEHKPYEIVEVGKTKRSNGYVYEIKVDPEKFQEVNRKVFELQGRSPAEVDWLVTKFFDKSYTLYVYTSFTDGDEHLNEYYAETSDMRYFANTYIPVKKTDISDESINKNLEPSISSKEFEEAVRAQFRQFGMLDEDIDYLLYGMSARQV